jgi:hypothetical protein
MQIERANTDYKNVSEYFDEEKLERVYHFLDTVGP